MTLSIRGQQLGSRYRAPCHSHRSTRTSNWLANSSRCGTMATELPRANWSVRPGGTDLLTADGSIDSSDRRSVWRLRDAQGRQTASPSLRRKSYHSARSPWAQPKSNGRSSFSTPELPALKLCAFGMTQPARFEPAHSRCCSSPPGTASRWRCCSVRAKNGGASTRLVNQISLTAQSSSINSSRAQSP